MVSDWRPQLLLPGLEQLDEQDPYEHASVNVCQYVVFIIALAALWYLTIRGTHTWPVLLLNWALFFILDDWALINSYSSALRGRVHPSAARRIHAFNVLLSVLLIYIAVQEFSTVGVVASLSALAAALYLRYVDSNYISPPPPIE